MAGEDVHPLVRALERRDEVSVEEKRLIEALPWRIRMFGADEEILAERDYPSECCFLLEGFSARTYAFRDGQRVVTAVQVPGDFVDLHSFLLKGINYSVLALSSCKVAFVPHRTLTDITQASPHLTRLLWTLTEICGAMQQVWITNLSRHSALERLAHHVCELFTRLEAVGLTNGKSFVFPATQTILSEILGLSNVHTNRMLQELRASGLLSWRRPVVTINDWNGLAELADFDPAYLNLHPERR